MKSAAVPFVDGLELFHHAIAGQGASALLCSRCPKEEVRGGLRTEKTGLATRCLDEIKVLLNGGVFRSLLERVERHAHVHVVGVASSVPLRKGRVVEVCIRVPLRREVDGLCGIKNVLEVGSR